MQNIPKFADLRFSKIDDDAAPELMCNNCGERRPGKGQLAAKVTFAKDAEFVVVICSQKCIDTRMRNARSSDMWLRHVVKMHVKKHLRQAIKNM